MTFRTAGAYGAILGCAVMAMAADPLAHVPLAPVTKHSGCSTHIGRAGMPIPDPACTPGGVNPTLTLEVLRDPHFRTGMERNQVTSEAEKASTYAMYGIEHPRNNHGATQTCELDHLVSIELGGSDTLDNIWPQCGPNNVVLDKRFFKLKDLVENYLAKQLKLNKTSDLAAIQHGIATDWTQYLAEAVQTK